MKANEITDQLANEIRQRFQDTAGDLIENIARGLVDAVLKMQNLYTDGTYYLQDLLDKDLFEEDKRDAIKCILAYARIGANEFPKSLLDQEKKQELHEPPLEFREVQGDFRLLFQEMSNRWDPNMSNLTYEGLIGAISSLCSEIPIILNEMNVHSFSNLSTISADICNHVVVLLKKAKS